MNKIADWSGWRFTYYCVIMLIFLLIISHVSEISDVLIKTNEQRIKNGGIPIPAECCWEYHNKTNALIYNFSAILIYISFFLLSIREKNYFSKIIVALFPLIFSFLLNSFFIRNI